MGRPETKWGVGTCFDCGRDIAMKTDGRLRRHGPLEQTCGGSGSVPVSYEQILLAAVREGVESGTIEGEVVRWCVKHNSAMFTNHGETCHMSHIGGYRLGRNPFDRITCDVEERLFVGPVSDGGSET